MSASVISGSASAIQPDDEVRRVHACSKCKGCDLAVKQDQLSLEQSDDDDTEGDYLVRIGSGF